MPLEESYSAEQFQTVPENQRDWYRQDGDKFVLDVVPRKVNNGTLEAKRKAEQEAVRLKTSWGDIDPEEAKQLVEEKRKRESEEAAKKGDVEAILARERKKLKDAADKEKADLEAKLSESAKREARYVRDEALTRAALESGVRKEAIEDVLLLGGSQLSVKDGQLVDAEGDKVEPAKWLKEILSKRKHWMGESSGGGTAKGGDGNGIQRAGLQRSKMTPEQKAQFQKKYGFGEYNKLPY